MRGFTLVELLVVLMIVAILAAVAFPSYQSYTTRSNRSDGYVLATEILQAQERHFVENLTYTADLTDLGYATATDISSERGYYFMTASACTGLAINQCVLITGVAQGMQVSDGDMSINSHGTKTGSW